VATGVQEVDMAQTERLSQLRQNLIDHFSDGELRDLCFDLGVDYENLPGQTKADKARELLSDLDHRGRIPELIQHCSMLRSNVAWQEILIAIQAEPPFKGLQYFDEADADLFFGRELLTARLVGRLRQERFLAVVGASGSGKSSVVRAGLVPALKHGEPLADGSLPPEGSTRWQFHVMTPTAHPLKELATSLTRDSESVTATATLMDDLAGDARSLDLAAARLLKRPGSGNRLLLVVDQFEELFTARQDEAERKAFVDNLLHAAASETEGFTIVVIALRADFYHHCAQYPNLFTALEKHQANISKMSLNELRSAIEEPARLNGWEFESGLVDLILRDVGEEPGALPLLSHALLETWKRRHGRTLTLEGYHESGEVRGAIARTADGVFNRLTPEQQTIARNIFIRLTELGEGTQDTRRRAALSELIAHPEDKFAVEAVLKTLADARLVTTSEDMAEVAHEALIREWPALREWLDDDREGLRTQRCLTEAAQEWLQLHRDQDVLYRGARLSAAREWAEAHADELNVLEREFLDASKALAEREVAEREAQQQRELEAAQRLAEETEARRQAEAERAREAEQSAARLKVRNRIITVVGMLALLAAIVAGFLGYRSNQNAIEAQRQATLAMARQLAAQAVARTSSQFDLSLLLSLESLHIADTAEARGSLLAGLQDHPQILRYLRGHTGSVTSVAFSLDGKTLASASDDRTIILWNVATRQPLGTLPTEHTDTIWNVAFSPDGKTLASAGWDKNIILWDVATRQSLGPPLTGHTDRVYSVAFSPDGKTLASASRDKTIILWDVATRQPLGPPLTGHAAGVESVAFSPDGKTLASAGDDKTIILWDVATRQPLGQPLTDHTDLVASVAWNADGKMLASASWDRTIILWDVATRQPLGPPLTRHTDCVESVAFSPAPSGNGTSSQTLVSASRDRTIILWNISTALNTGSTTRQPLGPVLTGHTDLIESVAFSPDGKLLASASKDGTIILWDVSIALDTGSATRQPLGQPLTRHTDAVTSLAFSPTPPGGGTGGRMLASASGDNTVILWDVATRQPLGPPLTGHTGFVRGVAFSPNGKTLASGGDKTIILWNVATRQPLGLPLTEHNYDVTSVAFSPDSRALASASYDKTIILWDVTKRQPLGPPLTGHAAGVASVAFSPDGKTLASAGWDWNIILWDVATRQPLGSPLTGHTDRVYSVAFSPDGKTLASASADQTIILWDVATRQPLGPPLTGHAAGVASVAFSPDGKTLASASDDKTIILWDVATRQPLGQPLTGHTGEVASVAFSPDGKTPASASRDKTIILWDVSVESWEARACEIVARKLTGAEWASYLPERKYHKTCEQWPEGK